MEADKHTKFNGFTTKKGNYIWAGALTLAWNQLTNSIAKQPIKIDSNDQNALHIVDNFNHTKFSIKDIDPHSVYVKAGFGQETVNKINIEVKKKFPQKSFADINIKLGEMDLIAYAYLLKNIEFKIPFKRSEGKTFEFEDKKVDSFYAENQDQKEQICYSYYRNPEQFMININGKNPGDLIYLIKNKEIQDCEQAIKAVEFYESKGKNKLKSIDHFQMPVVDLNLQREVKELLGKKLKNKNLPGYSFEYVFEAIKLKIDEKGAKVQNQAIMAMLGAAFSKTQPQPKFFILDKQFWVVMKQANRHPYICVLIKDPIDQQ